MQHPGACWSDPQIVHNGIIVTQADGSRHVGLPFTVRVVAEGAIKRARKGDKPLQGLRIVDCGAFVAGPLAGVALAELGADVIKIEARQGDPNRSIFKSFCVANHAKRVIGIDMKHADGLKIMHQLCADADAVLNNFRPGVAQRLGVDPQSLSRINPALIALEAPAFGNDGPAAAKAGFDMVMQAWTGHEVKAAGAGNPPRWNRTNLVDIAGGMIGSVALLAALLHRERTGRSVALESPLCNAGIYTLSELIQRPDGSFVAMPQLGGSLSGYTPTECLYQAADGWVAIVARGARAIAGLRSALDLEEALAPSPNRWGENEERLIAARIATLDLAQLKAALESHGVWVEPCRDGKEQQILTDPDLIARGTVRVTQHAAFGQINEIGTVFTLSRSALGNDLPAPMPGAHTRETLVALGYDETAIETLYATQAVT